MPSLRRLDESAEELAVHEYCASAVRPAATAHHPGCDDRHPASAGSAVVRGRVLRLIAPTTAVQAALAAEALVRRDGEEPAEADRALAQTEGAGRSCSKLGRTAGLAGCAQGLVSVRGVEPERAASTDLQHDESPRGIQLPLHLVDGNSSWGLRLAS